ncbi:MAG: hypothetical protein Q8O76_10710, partial [Chloroflexota bacterium]|nr:hypothetical protein [Chloroflexota bacterium]
MVRLEMSGIPAVAIVSKGFESTGRASADSMGMSSYRFATVDHLLTGLSPEQIRRDVEQAFPQILSILTTSPEGDGAAAVDLPAPPAGLEKFQGIDQLDALAKMNATFLEHQWGDGFPVVPPTPQAVQAMLKGTSRDPQDVVAVVEPGMGVATVEKIAINAVMA